MVRSVLVSRIPRRKIRRNLPWSLTRGWGRFGPIFLALAGLSHAGPTEPSSTVILISLDGTRPADLNATALPVLTSLANQGLRAERMTPVFPSNTFPNHVTLVTGVRPQEHGIVNNSFRDPRRGVFRKQEIPSWVEVEPLWSLLGREGVPSASYHWVGSEGPWPGGGGPAYWKPFDAKTPEMTKVEQVLKWLQIEEACQRPRFVTLWFHGADHAGHVYGPGSDEVVRSLRLQDRALARLWSGLADLGIRDTTTLVLLSDHGMAEPSGRVDLTTELAAAGVEASVFGTGGFAIVELHSPSVTARSEAVAVIRDAGLSGYPREEAPEKLEVGHERFGDIVVIAPSTKAIVRPGLELRGFHGYPAENPAMSAFLAIVGPGVPAGRVIPEARSLDIAPTLLALLGVEAPTWMQGSPISSLKSAYRKATSPRRFAKLHRCGTGLSAP